MEMFKYLFISILIFGIGDYLGVLTKAKLSAVFVSLILFLVGFMTGILPANIIELAGLTDLGRIAGPFLIFHMGTMINIKELLAEGRTVILAVISMLLAALACIVIIPIIGKENAFVSIPVLNGGIISTGIMTEAAIDRGFALSAALGTIVYAVQKFVGTPVASYYGLKEAREILDEYRKTGIKPMKSGSQVEGDKRETFAMKNSKFYGNFVCLTITAFFAWISHILGDLTPVSYSIWALLLGAVTSYMGIVPERILEKANSSGILNMAVFASIIPSLAKIEVSDLATLGLQTGIIFVALIAVLYVFVYILPLWKIVGSKNMAMGISVSQLLGFPATYLISNEIANAVTEDEEERQIVLDAILPKYVIGGLATVTSLSIVMAGIFEKLL